MGGHSPRQRNRPRRSSPSFPSVPTTHHRVVRHRTNDGFEDDLCSRSEGCLDRSVSPHRILTSSFTNPLVEFSRGTSSSVGRTNTDLGGFSLSKGISYTNLKFFKLLKSHCPSIETPRDKASGGKHYNSFVQRQSTCS